MWVNHHHLVAASCLINTTALWFWYNMLHGYRYKAALLRLWFNKERGQACEIAQDAWSNTPWLASILWTINLQTVWRIQQSQIAHSSIWRQATVWRKTETKREKPSELTADNRLNNVHSHPSELHQVSFSVKLQPLQYHVLADKTFYVFKDESSL